METKYDPPEPIDSTGPTTPLLEPALESQPPAPILAPPAKRRRSGRSLAIIAGALALFILLLGGGAALANSSLSATYSPGRAVTDYLAAQSRGDVKYMLANANYPQADSGPDNFVNAGAVSAMMALEQNRAIAGVRVTAVDQLDSQTDRVTVSMTWAGKARSQTYVVHQDSSRRHYLFYYSWRVDIPSSTITVQLPPQPGGVGIDGTYGEAVSTETVIQGYHTVAMHETDFYDAQTQLVDATADTASVDFSSAQLSASAVAAAAAVIKESFQPAGITCDTHTNFDCPYHRYTPDPGTFALLGLPGAVVPAFVSWIFTITGDPTAGMKLVVGDKNGTIAASGTCTMQLLVDGKSKYNYRGTWKGTLTWSNGGFGYEGSFNCDEFAA